MDLINLVIIFILIINFVLLLILHLRSPKSRSIKYFKLAVFAVFMWCLSMVFFRGSNTVESSIVWAQSLYAFAALIPTAFVLHALAFPNNKIKKWIIASIITLNALIFVVCFIEPLIISNVVVEAAGEKQIIFGSLYYILYPAYISFFFLLAYLAYFFRKKQVSKIEQYQLKFITVGLLVSSSIGMLTNLILPTFGVFTLNWAGQVTTTFWLALISYSIIKHRFIDVRLIIIRAITYLLFVGILLVFVGLIIILVSNSLLGLNLSIIQLTLLALIFIVAAIFFSPLKRQFDQITAQLFFRNVQSPSEILATLNKNIASHLEIDDLGKLVVSQLSESIHASHSSLIIFQKNTVAYSYYSIDKNAELDKDSDLIRSAVKNQDKLLILDEINEGTTKDKLRSQGYSLVLAFSLRDELVGGLLIGEKETGSSFTEQDISLLQLVGPELAIAFKNSLSYNEIVRFNITLREEVDSATASLKKANARLRELDRMKDEFVSLASHELRTPLTSIKYNLWMTLQGKAGSVTEKQKMYLERAYSSTTRLTKMVNDMLNISRIESNRIILNPFRSKLHTVAEDVIEEIRPHAKHLGVRLILVNYAVKPDSAEKVKLPDVIIDRDKIKEVLVNLIGNSLKFTPKDGQIRVWFEVDRDFVWVHITDSGIGFNPTKTRELFKKFGMIRESYAAYKDASQGTGLGLYICKSIISLHNGQIKAHSPGHNQGATFSFSVPIYSEQLKKHFAREFAGKTDAGIIMTQVMAE